MISNKDKLARLAGTKLIAVLTAKMDVPYWCTLTARESRSTERHAFYRRRAFDRRQLKNFIRALCA